jgi:hypothetical protein
MIDTELYDSQYKDAFCNDNQHNDTLGNDA